MASVASVENIRRINSGDADLGIAYSGDTFLVRAGQLPQDERRYRNIHALTYLYGAPVLAASGIHEGCRSIHYRQASDQGL